jgi:transposase-like protein
MNRTWNRRTSYSPERRAALVEEFRGSGQTQKAFALRHGIKWTTFRNWLYGAAKAAKARPLAKFQEIHLPPVGVSATSWGAEVSLANGTVVRLQSGADPRWAQAIIQPLLS